MGDTEPLPAAGRGGLPETCPVEHARVRRYRREDLRFDLRRGQYVFFCVETLPVGGGFRLNVNRLLNIEGDKLRFDNDTFRVCGGSCQRSFRGAGRDKPRQKEVLQRLHDNKFLSARLGADW